MTVKATENCVKNLMAKGINVADIVVLNPTITLDTVELQSLRIKIECTRQVDISNSSSENWFESCLECMDMTEAELDTMMTESEEDNLLSGPIDCIVQAINSIHFDEPQCPILRRQNQLQAKELKIDVLEQNPLFFEMFKQKLYKEFQNYFWYSPLLQYMTIHNFQWQVMWLWEFLVNTPIDENTYDWLQTLINV